MDNTTPLRPADFVLLSHPEQLGTTQKDMVDALSSTNRALSPGGYIHQLSLQFARAPHDDVFNRMTDQQMVEFHLRILTPGEELEKARRTGSTEPLRRMFGHEFPKE